MSLIDKLRERCKAAGLTLPKGVQIRRTHAGSNQRACGAWSWFLVDKNGYPYSNNHKGQIGSQYPASVLVRRPVVIAEPQAWGDINIDPE